MVRILALVALCGCNLVVGLDEVAAPPKQVCGPYGPATPVMFSADLMAAGAHDLSVVDDGMHGAVVEDHDNTWSTIPVVLDATMTWAADPDVPTTGLESVRGHRIAQDAIVGTTSVNSNQDADLYKASTLWATQIPAIDAQTNFELYAGTERDVLAADGSVGFRTAILVKRRTSLAQRSLIEVTNFNATDTPPVTFHEDFNGTGPLNAQPGVEPTHAVITDDRQTIVLAATVNDGASALFETTHDPVTSTWPAGDQVGGIDMGSGTDEPWINADCSRIWFRRGGVVYQADKQ